MREPTSSVIEARTLSVSLTIHIHGVDEPPAERDRWLTHPVSVEAEASR